MTFKPAKHEAEFMLKEAARRYFLSDGVLVECGVRGDLPPTVFWFPNCRLGDRSLE
jgi:hypothetical protein